MAQLFGFSVSIHAQRRRVLRPGRVMAIVAIAALLTGTCAPGWAAAAEPDSEGEGTAAPGLEDPHFEPGGEETGLESLPGVPETAESEEAGEGPPIETEPAQEPELTEPAPPAEVAPPSAAPDPESSPSPIEAPASAPPAEYAPAAPEYVTPPAPSAPVENDAIVAPQSASAAPRAEPQSPEATAPEAEAEAPAVVPSGEPEPPAQEAPPPAPAAVADPGGAGPPLRGRSSYTVRPGDCLWSIAAALLPAGAGNEEIAAEVARLWRLNGERIGSGDPNVILVGTQLTLG